MPNPPVILPRPSGVVVIIFIMLFGFKYVPYLQSLQLLHDQILQEHHKTDPLDQFRPQIPYPSLDLEKKPKPQKFFLGIPKKILKSKVTNFWTETK